jgi:dipeptidase E
MASMRMLLTSNGLYNDTVREAFVELLDRPIGQTRLVVVIDAILPFAGDKSKLLEHLSHLRGLGFAEMDVVSLFAGPPALVEQRLRSADAILGYGGSNIWLAHAWRATGLDRVLRELLDEKVYVGWSAGSMIFSRLHAAAVRALDDDEPEVFEVHDPAPAVPLFDWFVLGHLGADYFPHWTDDWAGGVATRMGGPTWFLDDESALLVRDPDRDPEVVSSGHWLRFDAGGTLVDSR